MQNERQRILAMLENGKITTDEALTLLETLGQSEQTGKTETQSQEDIFFPRKSLLNTMNKLNKSHSV